VGEVIGRATFDPEWALDDPDVTLLDVGHPLVRRLIEEVKQDVFRAGASDGENAARYGRTAYVVTPDVDEVTALYHLLARYVIINTEPTAIVEELLPVAVPMYALADALAFRDLEQVLQSAVEERRQVLMTERQRMRQQMEAQEDAVSAEWLKGIDDLSPGSVDLVALTVLWPQ
jgi:hypothetical protein